MQKASAVSRPSREDTVFTRRQIEGLIAEGKHVLIYESRVLKVDAWLPFHPGGDVSIKHMVGRDATDEINAYVVVGVPRLE
jgi:delta8-fatty-acid desaturase